MERQIDFARDRYMLCEGCGHGPVVNLDWIDRWEQGAESCPGCGLTCEYEDAPRVTVDPEDPALDSHKVALFPWYHSSTQPDWPTRDFDPAEALTAEIRTMMGGDRHVAEWAARQRAKALHVGTYEAAIHNMLRRIDDQADRGNQFYLYRVHLKPSVVVRDGWLIDPSNFVGDVVLDEVCPPGVDVTRYLNYHEDPGGLSLALGRDAIATVQQVTIPLPDVWDDGWVRDAVAVLENASETVAAAPETGWLSRLSPPPPSPRALTGNKLAAALAGRLPVNLQGQFSSATALADEDNPRHWARQTIGLFGLFEDADRVLAALDSREHRQV